MLSEEYVYPFDWERGLPQAVADAYTTRDCAALHLLARRARNSGESTPEELAAVMHALAFALGQITIMHERIMAYGAVPGANQRGRPHEGISSRGIHRRGS